MVRPDQASLIAKRIGHITIQACAHRDYLERRGLPKQIQDLLAHDLIAGDQNREVDLGFEAQVFSVEDLHFAVRSDDLIAQWAAVKAGPGIGFVPDYLVRNEPTVKVVLPFLDMPQFPVWLTVHRELQTSARIRAVYDFLASQVPLFFAKHAVSGRTFTHIPIDASIGTSIHPSPQMRHNQAR